MISMRRRREEMEERRRRRGEGKGEMIYIFAFSLKAAVGNSCNSANTTEVDTEQEASWRRRNIKR